MSTKLYNLMLLGYVGGMLYVVTEPWHDQIGDAVFELIRNVKNTYNRGQFVMEAKIDTMILTKGM